MADQSPTEPTKPTEEPTTELNDEDTNKVSGGVGSDAILPSRTKLVSLQKPPLVGALGGRRLTNA